MPNSEILEEFSDPKWCSKLIKPPKNVAKIKEINTAPLIWIDVIEVTVDEGDGDARGFSGH